jgi:membrane protein implicated in regulation of membrane protease activity
MFWVALPEIIVVSTASLAALFAVAAVSVRVALRPTFQARSSVSSAREQAELQERRIALLEAETSALHQEVRALTEADAFNRQLGVGRPS